MKVLLVDDEQLQLVRLENAVKKVLGTESERFCFQNPVKAIEFSSSEKIDLAFLDIEMPVVNGIQLAKILKSQNPAVNIIFVTAYSEYALDAYSLHASGYLTKPVSEEMVSREVENLRYPVEWRGDKRLQVKCFGSFEVFAGGIPLKFRYGKSKELFAYLIDREGASVNANELNAVLWEEDHKSYFRNLVSDVQNTLKNVGAGNVFCKRRNEFFVDTAKVDCDAYAYKRNDPDAVRAYRGEYMAQYPWAIFDYRSEEEPNE